MNEQNGMQSGRITDYLARKALYMNIPLAGTFELSPVCNFSCKMCYVRKTQKEIENSDRKILGLNDWLRIAKEARDAGMLYLLLTGGEPLMWPHFWQLYETLIDMGFLVSINTNGALINKAAVERFQKRPPQKINITLYGANDKTYKNLCGVKGVFDKVEKAIKDLVDKNITVKINCSLTPDNANDLEWIVDYARECGVQLQVTTYMFPPVRRDPTRIGENERFTPEESARYLLKYLELNRGKEAYYQYLKNIEDGCIDPPGLDEGCVDLIDGKVRCRAGRSSFWITWDGWLTPCGMMPEPKTDLKIQTFSEAWRKIVNITDNLRLSGVCNNCPNSNICHPCAAIAYAETGEITGIPIYMCKVSKEMQKIARETLHIENIMK